MGENNPRLRKSQELAEADSSAHAQTSEPTEANAGTNVKPWTKASTKAHVRKSIKAASSVKPETTIDDASEVAPNTNPETDEEAAERTAAALERHARARRERIEQDDRKRHRRRIIRRTLFGIVFAVLFICIGLLVAFGIFRWQTYDDVADIQGVWYHEGTTMPVTITEDEIVLTDDVAYRYVLDPEAKTILFKFGNMEGSGRYRFSLDRTELMIADGEFDWMNTFISDALWTAQSLISQYVFANEMPLATGDEHETVFTREANPS